MKEHINLLILKTLAQENFDNKGDTASGENWSLLWGDLTHKPEYRVKPENL